MNEFKLLHFMEIITVLLKCNKQQLCAYMNIKIIYFSQFVRIPVRMESFILCVYQK
jgi:hypothetical protein